VSKVFKNIAIFSIWMAGLVIVAHLLIPHDHHSDSSVFSKDNECRADNTKLPVKAPIFPFHCHALNDLTFEKTTPSFVIYNNFPVCDLFTIDFLDSVIPKTVSSRIRIKDFQTPVIETDFLRLSHFRAPPALV
jgi:hypothetical protein